MSGDTQPDWKTLARAVRDMLNGAKPESMDHDLVYWLVAMNLIAREEVKKPCKSCGQNVHDYGWWRITPAARTLVLALEEIEALKVQPS